MKAANSNQRALCVWLPHWPLQRLYGVRPELRRSPLAIYEEYRSGLFRVVDCCRLAKQHGVRPGMPLAEASALTTLRPEKLEPQLDRTALERVAEWCEQFSPAIAVEAPDCLLMDVTGLIPIFGSEQLLVTHMRRAFHQRRLKTHIAVTDTYAAAWALAHFSERQVLIVPPGEMVSAIAPLPIAALKLPESIVATLYELGIDSIGRLAAIPRESLAARFDAILLRRLNQALGTCRETLLCHRAAPELLKTFEFEYPVTSRSALETTVMELLADIIPQLVVQQKGITKFICEFRSETEPPVHMTVGLYQPTTNLKHLRELAQLQLEQLKFAGSVNCVRLWVCSTARMQSTQMELFGDENSAEHRRQLSLLVNRLSSRLGQSAVLRAVLLADAQAEFAYRYLPFTDRKRRSAAKSVKSCGPLQRPIHVLPKPLPLQVLGVAQGPPRHFRLRGAEYRITHTWGPERIQTGWWRGNYIRRDYYRVESNQGNRYWLFRASDGVWFLHGVFD